MPCLRAGASGELSVLEDESGLFSLLLVESCFASTSLFSAIAFLDGGSLALSTDIGFPYRPHLRDTFDKAGKCPSVGVPLVEDILFKAKSLNDTGHPSMLWKSALALRS